MREIVHAPFDVTLSGFDLFQPNLVVLPPAKPRIVTPDDMRPCIDKLVDDAEVIRHVLDQRTRANSASVFRHTNMLMALLLDDLV